MDMNENYVQYKGKLNEIYRPVFERVETYVATQNIDMRTRQERMSDLLDIFLNAQSEGKPVHKLVGNDIDRFCKNFCSDFTVKNRIAFIIDSLKYVIWTPALMVIFNIGSWIATEEAKADNYNFFHCMSWGNILTYLIIFISMVSVILITNVIMRNIMFKMKRLSYNALLIVYLAEAVIMFTSFMGFRLFEISLSIPTWIIVLVLIIYYVLYYLLCGRYNRRSKVKLSKNEEMF